MCPDLMGSSGLELELDDRAAAEILDHAVAGDGALAIRDDRPSVVVTGIAPVRTSVLALPGLPAVDGRAVAAVQRPRGELAAMRVVGGRGLRERDEPAGAAIEAMGRPRPVTRPRLIGTRARDPQHRVEQRAGAELAERMDVHAVRLVDDDERVVIEHDRERVIFGNEAAGVGRELVAGANFVVDPADATG